MFKKLRNKIESKRESKNKFWKTLVFAKDLVWKFLIFVNDTICNLSYKINFLNTKEINFLT